MKRYFALLIACILLTGGACGQIKNPPAVVKDKDSPKTIDTPEQITEIVGENKLILQNADGKCDLLFGKQTIELNIPSKCDFHRLPGGNVRVFPRDFYEAKNKQTPKEYQDVQIVLIEHSKPLAENPKECRTELQAIKITNGKIIKSIKMDNLAACPPFQWDEINFIGLFEKRK